jgi:hypothetical protein
VKYAPEILILAKEEKVLNCMVGWVIEAVKCYGIKTNIEKLL